MSPQLPGGTWLCSEWHRSSRLSQHSTGSPSTPRQLRGLSTQCATVHTHAREHTCNGSTATQPVVQGGGSVTLLLSPSDCLLQANHTPSPCLSFPTGAGGPSSFTGHEPDSSRGPGCWFCPGLGTPCAHQPAHTAVHTSAHAGHTCRSQTPVHALHRAGSHRPLHTQAHTLPARPLLCTRVCNHTHVQAHTRTRPPRSAAPTAPPLRPPRRLRGNASDLSMEPLRENAPGEAGGSGGWPRAGGDRWGTDRGQTDRWGGAVEGRVQEGAVHACKANVQAWRGHAVHTRVQGKLGSLDVPPTPSPRLSQPHGPPADTGGCWGRCALVDKGRAAARGGWQPEGARADAQEPGLSLLGPLPRSGVVERG